MNPPKSDSYPYKKRKRHQSSLSPPCEEIARRQPGCEPEAGPHQRPNLPASRTVGKKCLFKPPRLWYFVMAARDDLDTSL